MSPAMLVGQLVHIATRVGQAFMTLKNKNMKNKFPYPLTFFCNTISRSKASHNPVKYLNIYQVDWHTFSKDLHCSQLIPCLIISGCCCVHRPTCAFEENVSITTGWYQLEGTTLISERLWSCVCSVCELRYVYEAMMRLHDCTDSIFQQLHCPNMSKKIHLVYQW